MASTTIHTPELDRTIVNAIHEKDAWLARGRELVERGCELAKGNTKRQFAVGDWLIDGEERFQKKAYDEALKLFTGYKRTALRNLASVARKVSPSLRNDVLSWEHHRAVSKFVPAVQKQFLEDAITNKWSYRDLREQLPKIKPIKNQAHETYKAYD